jgi:2-oxoglutarate ferredoxin oxidoreductase subunit delta
MSRNTPSAEKLPDSQSSKGKRRAKKFYDIFFFRAWCKQCGLCVAFCPKKIISSDKAGRPSVTEADRCTGCRSCEIHCPDFAITVKERVPRRRKDDE